MLFEVFFQGEILLEDVSGDVFADEAEMPRLVGVAGDVFFAFRIAENEAVFCEFFVNLGESVAVGNHLVVFSLDGSVGFDDENVDGEAGVMFAVANFGEVLFAVVGAFFWVGRPFVPNGLLFFGAAVGAVEFDLDAVLQEFFAEGVEVCQGDFFDEEVFPEGVLGGLQDDPI